MKKLIFVSVFTYALTISAQAQNKPATKPVAKSTAKSTTQKTVFKNMLDSVSYAIGLSEAKFMKQQGITKLNSSMLAKAIDDVINNREQALTDQQANACVMSYINLVQQDKSKGAIAEGEKFLAENKKKPGVISTGSGLQYEVIREGTGIHPTAEDSVTCNYMGMLINGTEVDNSYKRGEPVTFALRGVISGWTEGLQHMSVGSKYKFYVPYKLGYGLQDNGAIPGGSTLIFEVELLDVKKNP